MTTEQTKASQFNSVPETDRSRLIGARRHAQATPKDAAARERPNTLGGMSLQLGIVGEIPGYHLYWENDENGAVERLLMEGFDFVTQDELYSKKASIVPDLDISSVISRFVKGMRVDGQPLRAYLMKCPDEVWAARESGRYAEADARDRAIYEKAVNPNRAEGFRALENSRTTIDTTYRKEYLHKG
jgi:hypothetical protein